MVPRISLFPGHSGGAISRTAGGGQESGADTVDWVRRHSRRGTHMERRAAGFGPAGVVGHRPGGRAERRLRDDVAIAIPQGATHQHTVHHHHWPVAAADEMIGNRCRRRSWRRTGIVRPQVTLL